jgi:hypothetical protein
MTAVELRFNRTNAGVGNRDILRNRYHHCVGAELNQLPFIIDMSYIDGDIAVPTEIKPCPSTDDMIRVTGSY